MMYNIDRVLMLWTNMTKVQKDFKFQQAHEPERGQRAQNERTRVVWVRHARRSDIGMSSSRWSQDYLFLVLSVYSL